LGKNWTKIFAKFSQKIYDETELLCKKFSEKNDEITQRNFSEVKTAGNSWIRGSCHFTLFCVPLLATRLKEIYEEVTREA